MSLRYDEVLGSRGDRHARYRAKSDLGDDELPSSLEAVRVSSDAGLTVTQISMGETRACAGVKATLLATGWHHDCALLSDGSLWKGAAPAYIEPLGAMARRHGRILFFSAPGRIRGPRASLRT